MRSKYSKFGIQKFSALCAAAFVFVSLLPQTTAAAAENLYMVQLKSPARAALLSSLGQDVKKIVYATADKNFQNIYQFESAIPLPILSAQLKPYSNYVNLVHQFTAQDVVANDPGFTSNNQDIDKQWGLVKAGFPQAWEQTIGSNNTVVAIIDTGVDATHQDLQHMNLVDGYDFVNNKPLSGRFNSDDNGHGTLITGVLAATANNAIGIAGTNWNISIMPIKALDSSGKGDSTTVAQAIVWATDHGANIINLSFGGFGFDHDQTLANAITYAYNKNIVIVAAAGNDTVKTGDNLDQQASFPVCDDNNYNMVIGVAATDQNDLKADFSNYGQGCIDVAAPGKRILSTINVDPITGNPAPNSYAYASGTSLAVPYVSGEAALIRALHPEYSNVQIQEQIILTADNIDDLNLTQCNGGSCAGLLGAGRINVAKAVDQPLSIFAIHENSLVKSEENGEIFQIVGGQRRPVSAFVFNQRFPGAIVSSVSNAELSLYPEGTYVAPFDGTLVKSPTDNTVYSMQQGIKIPITYQIFLQRQLNFATVNVVSFSELNSWVVGNFLPPLEGSLIKSTTNKTIYWVVGGQLHPINYNFYEQTGLQIFPVMTVDQNDIANFPIGSPYVK